MSPKDVTVTISCGAIHAEMLHKRTCGILPVFPTLWNLCSCWDSYQGWRGNDTVLKSFIHFKASFPVGSLPLLTSCGERFKSIPSRNSSLNPPANLTMHTPWASRVLIHMSSAPQLLWLLLLPAKTVNYSRKGLRLFKKKKKKAQYPERQNYWYMEYPTSHHLPVFNYGILSWRSHKIQRQTEKKPWLPLTAFCCCGTGLFWSFWAAWKGGQSSSDISKMSQSWDLRERGQEFWGVWLPR